MLTNELNNLTEQLKSLTSSIEAIFDQLDKLIASNNKNYTIQFGKKTFDFHPPITKHQSKVMKRNRHKLIKLIILATLTEYVQLMPAPDLDVHKVFESILCFTYGPDPKDLQMESVELSDMLDSIQVENEKAIALNLESPYVQADLKGEHVQAN